MERNQSISLDTFPNELSLILALLQSPDRPDRAAAALGLLESGVDWRIFLSLLKDHRLYPTLYQSIQPRERALIPTEILDTIKGLSGHNVLQMLYLTSELDRIQQLFEENGIRSLLLKGPGLAHLLHGDIAMRTSKDLDILVPLEDFERAEELLLQAGYRLDGDGPRILNEWKIKRRNDAYYHPEKRIQIELHWRLYANLGKEPSFNELWERKLTQRFSNVPIHSLGKEDLFFYLVAHGAKHAWFRLRWLLDIDRLVDLGIDWTRVKKLFEAYHCRHLAGQALLLSSVFFHTTVPEVLKPCLFVKKSQSLASEVLPFIRGDVPVDPNKQFNRYWYHLLSHRHKWAYAKRMMYPSFQDAQTLPLPRSLHLLYFPLRPFLWLWRRIAGLRPREA